MSLGPILSKRSLAEFSGGRFAEYGSLEKGMAQSIGPFCLLNRMLAATLTC
jgi:hypothetical protein